MVGPGWVWGLLVVLALLCVIVGLVGFLWLILTRPARTLPKPSGSLRDRLGEEGRRL